MIYQKAIYEQLAADVKGKVVESLEWTDQSPIEPNGYWTMTFTNGSEISFRFMAELQGILRPGD